MTQHKRAYSFLERIVIVFRDCQTVELRRFKPPADHVCSKSQHFQLSEFSKIALLPLSPILGHSQPLLGITRSCRSSRRCRHHLLFFGTIILPPSNFFHIALTEKSWIRSRMSIGSWAETARQGQSHQSTEH